MLPSVSPYVRSRSSGVSTCAASIVPRKPGADSSILPTTCSRSSSRRSSHVPRRSANGTYCTNAVITCTPGGASESSTFEAVTQSTQRSVGDLAVAMTVVDGLGLLERRDERGEGPAVGVGVRGHPRPRRLGRQDEVHLRARPGHLDRGHIVAEVLGELSGIDQIEERALRIGVGQHDVAGELLTALEHHARSRDRPARSRSTRERPSGSRRPPRGPRSPSPG